MKIRIIAPLVALLACVVGLIGQGTPPPTTSTSFSTASTVVDGERQGPGLMDVGPDFPGATIEVIPYLGPAPGTERWWTVAKLIEQDYRSGTLGQGTEYLLCRGKIDWINLVVPGDWILQQLVVVKTTDGSDSISLSSVVVKATSTAGALSDEYRTGSLGYSDAAIGVRSNRSVITSGPGDQLAAEIYLGTVMKLFVGGDTQTGRDAARNWVLAQNNFTIVYEVNLSGDSTGAKGGAQVSLEGFLGTAPRLGFGTGGIYLVNGDPGRTYTLWSSDSLTGEWKRIGLIQLGETIPQAFNQPARFYRAVGE